VCLRSNWSAAHSIFTLIGAVVVIVAILRTLILL
jgi:hypothetical protein